MILIQFSHYICKRLDDSDKDEIFVLMNIASAASFYSFQLPSSITVGNINGPPACDFSRYTMSLASHSKMFMHGKWLTFNADFISCFEYISPCMMVLCCVGTFIWGLGYLVSSTVPVKQMKFFQHVSHSYVL